MTSFRTSRGDEAGVAMIMVLAVLAGLMVLAAPFLFVAVQEQQASVGPLARAQAEARVDAALRHARYILESGHGGLEALRDQGDPSEIGTIPFQSPFVDGPDEVTVLRDLLGRDGKPKRSSDGLPYFGAADPRGVVVDLSVEDDHARPNIWSAPPFLIASVLGRTVLAKDLEREEAEELRVEDASAFPLENGRLLVGGEVIAYKKREGSRFTGLSRAVEGLGPRQHVAETWVLDDRARQIAMIPWKSPRANGGWREPVFPGALKEIALFSELSLSPAEIERLERAFSFTGRRFAAGAFGPKTPILTAIEPVISGNNGFQVRVASADGFAPGTVVRISDGQRQDFGMVAESTNGIRLFEAPRNSYAEGTASIQPLLRHPVNINTASEETLKRLIYGLQSGFGGRARGAEGRVEQDATDIIVSAIQSRRPLRDLKELRTLIEDQIAALPIFVNDFTGQTVFRNAVDPGDRNMATSTVPFSFASFDHYTVRAAAAVQDRSGRRLAVEEVRERVRVAPPGLLETIFDTQAEFEDPYVRARQGRYTVSHPLPVERFDQIGSVPASRVPRMLYRFGTSGQFAPGADGESERENGDATVTSGQGGVWPSRTDGDVRLMPARTERSGQVGALFNMDGPGFLIPDNSVPLDRIDPEGFMITNRSYEVDPRDPVGGFAGFGGGRRGGGGGQGAAGALQRGTSPNPVRVDFWYRTGSGVSDGTPLFDFQSDETDGGRIQLLRQGNALIARVKDRTIDDPNDGVDEIMETRWEPEDPGFWRAETWYHIGLAYRGTKSSDLQLFVDGYARGRSRFASRLSGSLPAEGTSFGVEDAEGWPEQGVVEIGAEVIAYRRTGNSFDVLSLPANDLVAEDPTYGRGQRGTKRQAHASGSEVKLFGYSILPRGADRNERRVIPSGGGRLGATLGPMRVCTIEANDRIEVSATVNRLPVTLRIEVFDESRGGILTLLEDGSSFGGQDFSGFPESGGYAVIVSREFAGDLGPIQTSQALPLGGIELVRYQSRNGNQLVGVQAAPRPGGLDWLVTDTISGGEPGGPVTTSRFISTSRVVHPVRFSASGRGTPSVAFSNYACVFPISIPVDQAQNYKTPEDADDAANFQPIDSVTWNGQSVQLNYPGLRRHPEFVQVGTMDFDRLENHDIEWIRYTNIDPQGHLLCDEEVWLLRVADILRTAYLGGPWYRPEFASTSRSGIDPAEYENHLFDGANPSDMLELVFPFREQMGTERLRGTSRRTIPRGTEVIPCIRTFTGAAREAIANPNWTDENPEAPLDVTRVAHAGYGDSVTLEERGGGERRRLRVSWAGRERGPRRWLSPFVDVNNPPERLEWRESIQTLEDNHGWIALDASIGRPMTQGPVPNNGEVENDEQRQRYTRILKFPSGEMPHMGRGARAAFGGSVDGQPAEADARLDEVRITTFAAEHFVLWDHSAMNLAQTGTGAAQTRRAGIDSGTDEIPLANVRRTLATPAVGGRWYMLADGRKVNFEEELQGLPNGDAGLVMIGAEIIAFRGIGRGASGAPALLDCVRGFMGTDPAEHAFGEPVVFLDYIPVSMLRDAVDAGSNVLPIIDAGDFQRNGGTVLIGDEMIHYTQFLQGGLFMPRRIEDDGELGAGLFRGRYGTGAAAHDVQSVVLPMPFRYWDRYAPRSDSGELAFFAVSLDLKGAFVHDVTVQRERTEGATLMEILVRTDPSIPWEADPDRTPGLYRATIDQDSTRLPIQRSAEGLEARVFFRYSSGAFEGRRLERHDWKSTPILESLRVRHLDRSRVLSREVLR